MGEGAQFFRAAKPQHCQVTAAAQEERRHHHQPVRLGRYQALPGPNHQAHSQAAEGCLSTCLEHVPPIQPVQAAAHEDQEGHHL